MGRVQLKYYDDAWLGSASDETALDLLEGVRACGAHRCPKALKHMAGWYAAKGLYVPEELGGLSVTRFSQAVRAEGRPVHRRLQAIAPLSSDFNTCEFYGHASRLASQFDT